MPTYEYVCEECGKLFDVFQSMNDPRLESCPDEACAGKVRRKIGTGAGIIFKGSGFYETDYRSDSYKAAEKKDSAAASDSGSSSGDKPSSDGEKSKPATPAPTPSTASTAPSKPPSSAGSTSGTSGQ